MSNPNNHLTSSSNAYVDGLYETYKTNPDDLDDSWQQFFKGFEFREGTEGTGFSDADIDFQRELNAFRLIQSFRNRGHFLSDTNPIRQREDRHAMIDLPNYGLSEADLQKEFLVGKTLGVHPPTLENIWVHMEKIYCHTIGIEYTHSNNTVARRWVRDKIENEIPNLNYSVDKKIRILKKLNEANVFETFLQAKFIGQKRFSLEGGESAIVAMDAAINHGAKHGVKEFVVGMAHRGRLNMLANTFGKTYEFIFDEFSGSDEKKAKGTDHHEGGGDVKYHLGYSALQTLDSGEEVVLKLMHNPSHLEAVAPVACGYARAQVDIYYKDTSKIVPILIHGDAAVAGQGIVYENLQMSELESYECGGAIHFVINNQIGFTTDYTDGRSSHYCTSLARTLDAPIIHVNGDDPEAVTYAMELAIEYRQKFKADVFVDMVCYRKHGHNEGDEPKYTQPHLYGLVAKHKNPRELYLEKLLQNGSLTPELAKSIQDDFKNLLSDRFNNVVQSELPQLVKGPHTDWLDLRWSKPEDFILSPDTSVKKSDLKFVLDKITTYPEGFKIIKKAGKLLKERETRFETDNLDWAICELLAYGTLLKEGIDIRFTGQDVIRGTFSHRHAKVFDENTNEAYCGLEFVNPENAMMRIYNSLLSEFAVLGFEYGYSLANPNGLNIWEAQFGDFSNSAQVIFDQFISAGESKWKRMTNLVVLLPHGQEGQGPEHSSARLERYLQLTGQHNMIIANCTTPANFFHIIRRQQKFEFRKPLIVFTPKSLLRHSRCVSTLSDLTDGRFAEIIDCPFAKLKKVKRVVMCNGKIYFELLKKQEEDNREDVAIIRIEQLYPFPINQFEALLDKYEGSEFYWAQEEPENMGAWPFLISRFTKKFFTFNLVARNVSASPATGFIKRHEREQAAIIDTCFTDINDLKNRKRNNT
jgi:2-oxoglutarate dehydrogenase E1 component